MTQHAAVVIKGKKAVHVEKGKRIVGVDRLTVGLEVKKRYEKMQSIREIADALGRSYGFVHRVLTERPEVQLRGRGGAARKSTVPKRA